MSSALEGSNHLERVRWRAQDEGAHEELAELAVGLQQRQQVFAIELDDFARFAGARPDERRAAGEHGDLAGELTGAMGGNERLGGAGWPNNLDLARRDDEKRHDVIARFDQHLAALDFTDVSVDRDPIDLRRRQSRKHALDQRGTGRWKRLRFRGHGDAPLRF